MKFSASLITLGCVLGLTMAHPPAPTAMPQQRHRLNDCFAGDCTVTINGRNTGTINGVRYGQPGQGTEGQQLGPQKGGHLGQANNNDQPWRSPNNRCFFGRCSVVIPGDNTEDIYMR